MKGQIVNIFGKVDHIVSEMGPLPGPKGGSCLTLGNETSQETLVLKKQEILLGRGAWVESTRVREPRSIARPCGNGVSFQVVSGQSF